VTDGCYVRVIEGYGRRCGTSRPSAFTWRRTAGSSPCPGRSPAGS